MGKTARLFALVIPALAVLIALGTWQVHRLGWKNDLIATIEQRQLDAPVALPSEPLDMQDWAFKPTTVDASFIEGAVFEFPARTLEGAVGRDVASLVQREDGSQLLVHLGWVPGDTGYEPPSGNAQLTGVVREPWEKTLFRPENQPQDNQWYWMDLSAMASAGTPIAPYYLALTPTNDHKGFPQPRPAKPEITNNHLEYAVTWYSFAVILLVIAIMLARRPTTKSDPTHAG